MANAANATIDRIDVITVNGDATFKVTQIAQLSKSGNETKIALTWAPTLKINKKQYTDVLLALDPSKNRVAAFPNSTTRRSLQARVSQPSRANLSTDPGGIALNPFNNDLLVVNLNDNNLVELNADAGSIVGSVCLIMSPLTCTVGMVLHFSALPPAKTIQAIWSSTSLMTILTHRYVGCLMEICVEALSPDKPCVKSEKSPFLNVKRYPCGR